jgi:arginase family enzyme
MPLRLLIDAGDVAAGDVTLIGTRNLDPPEVELITRWGIATELRPVTLPLYVAVDLDVVDPAQVDVHSPEAGGLAIGELEGLLSSLPRPVGAGFSGLIPSARNAATLVRLGGALRL